MENCIVCNARFKVSGNFNKNKQLTCRNRTCQRALKTMRQHYRRTVRRIEQARKSAANLKYLRKGGQ